MLNLCAVPVIGDVETVLDQAALITSGIDYILLRIKREAD
jgi:hypothetical protein